MRNLSFGEPPEFGLKGDHARFSLASLEVGDVKIFPLDLGRKRRWNFSAKSSLLATVSYGGALIPPKCPMFPCCHSSTTNEV